MGLRFRKSINLGAAKINLSKSGVGFSAGVKGYRVTKKAGGGTRTTASIPGTGISYTKDSKSQTKRADKLETAEPLSGSKTESKMFSSLFRVLSVLLFAFGILLLFAVPFAGVAAIAVGFLCRYAAKHYKDKLTMQEYSERIRESK